MTIISDCVLVESKSARDHQLERVSHEDAQSILDKVKALYFAVWKGVGAATTEQLAQFYEVPVGTVRPLIKPHQEEFKADGVKVLRAKALKDARCLIQLPPETSQALIWTPRAALRLGMILRDSAVAKVVRTSLLDAIEKVIPAQSARIRELELELELARAREAAARSESVAAQSQERLIQVSSAIVTMHGAGMLGLILGKPDAVIEQPPIVLEKNILVNQAGKPLKTFEGLSKTKLAKRYGMKKPQDLVNWLQSMGKQHLIQPGITTAPCQFVPFEYVPELDRLWAARQGSRQFLLGE
ncbi:hypothetical protein [Aliterella atlantica]|uniref:Uncharacterized protein n=1 Tax=Aliterella atlantica CENA595 TaxID=1618023 RepID=A0A0D8ZMA9_9CYAN|nr:hypothetical protein [Aliterella atlantica]KJH69502.1 hypothetical protein UH38_23385 [Aliterella atlantica CENA595]